MKPIPEEDYKRILELVPMCCVDLVIVKDSQVLLVKRAQEPGKGSWCIPGGRVFKNEKLEEAAIRKAKEEVGLDVEIQEMIGVYETMFDKGPFGSSVHTINVVFLADYAGGEVKLDSSSSDFKWISSSEEEMLDYAREVLDDSSVFE